MPQLFPKGYNTVMRVLLIALPLSGAGTGITLSAFYRSDYTTGVREVSAIGVPPAGPSLCRTSSRFSRPGSRDARETGADGSVEW